MDSGQITRTSNPELRSETGPLTFGNPIFPTRMKSQGPAGARSSRAPSSPSCCFPSLELENLAQCSTQHWQLMALIPDTGSMVYRARILTCCVHGPSSQPNVQQLNTRPLSGKHILSYTGRDVDRAQRVSLGFQSTSRHWKKAIKGVQSITCGAVLIPKVMNRL